MNPAASDRTIALYPEKWRLLRGLHFHRLLVPTPVVVVNDQGILCHPPGGLGFTFNFTTAITWPEIAAMYLHTLTVTARKGLQTIRGLAIIPNDPEGFIQRHHVVRLRTFPLVVSLPATETPVWIAEAVIAPVSLEDLLTQIRTRFQAAAPPPVSVVALAHADSLATTRLVTAWVAAACEDPPGVALPPVVQ